MFDVYLKKKVHWNLSKFLCLLSIFGWGDPEHSNIKLRQIFEHNYLDKLQRQ